MQGQTVFVTANIEHAPLARALARAAYAAGARYVDVRYVDPHIRRAHDRARPRRGAHAHAGLAEDPNARLRRQPPAVGITGDAEPDLLADLDGDRVGRARMEELNEIARELMIKRAINWTGVAFPNEGWAEQVFGEPDVERLWEAVAFCTRLDEDDPVQAWRDHMARLEERAAQMNERRFDALRYRGPGTDLTVGLLAEARWMSALFRDADGREYLPNMPTEEIFTTPDARRAEGVVTSTRPLALLGDVVEGLKLKSRTGRIVAGRGGEGSRRRARAACERRPRRLLRRARARRRQLARRPDRASRSSTRSTTRTRPATSPTASGSPRRSRASQARA